MAIANDTQQQVQMHAMARSITTSFNKNIPVGLAHFTKAYLSNNEGKQITVEDFIPSDFKTYINNTGVIRKVESVDDRVCIEKAEC